MLNANNPFLFASSSAVDPLAPADPIATAPGMPQSFVWSHLLVTLGTAEEPRLPAPAPESAPAATPAAADTAPEPVEPEPAPAAGPAVANTAPEPVAPQPTLVAAVITAPVEVAAPAPALVVIAAPAPMPATVGGQMPNPVPQEPAFDVYARLFQGIENRDLLADLQATIAPGSDWANAFGPPLG